MNQRATETILINTLVDNMNMKDLQQYVANDMADFVDKLTLNELINEIEYTLDEEFLDEMITTIKEKIKWKVIQKTLQFTMN